MTLEPWGVEMERMLNRKLRNAIAHADAMHDLNTGSVTWPKGFIAYPEFVAAVAATAQAPLLLLTVVKYIAIMNDLAEAT